MNTKNVSVLIKEYFKELNKLLDDKTLYHNSILHHHDIEYIHSLFTESTAIPIDARFRECKSDVVQFIYKHFKELTEMRLTYTDYNQIVLAMSQTASFLERYIGVLGLYSLNVRYSVVRCISNIVSQKELITKYATERIKTGEDIRICFVDGTLSLDCGICEAVELYLNSSIEFDIFQKLLHTYCEKIGVSPVFPICVGEYSLSEAELLYQNAPKWDNGAYGQARWKFIEDFLAFINVEEGLV